MRYTRDVLALTSAKSSLTERSHLKAMENAPGREAGMKFLIPSVLSVCWVSLAKSLSLSGPIGSFIQKALLAETICEG